MASEHAHKIDGAVRKLRAVMDAFDMKGTNRATMLNAINTINALRTRPVPVATDTGLVTVGYQYKLGDVWFLSDAPEVLRKAGYELREVVTRENAAAVIAKVEAEKAKAVHEAGHYFAETCMMAEQIGKLTDAELVTVLIQKRCTEPVDGYWGNSYLPVDKPFDTNWTDPESGKQYEHRALVTRENAEAEKAKAIKEAGKHFAKTCMMAEEICNLKEASSQAEELLAAEHDAKMFHVNDAVKAWNEVSRLETHVEALEAKLAAAQKALERAAFGFDQIHQSLMSNGPKQASGEITAFFLAETRAVLGGKPS